MKVENLKELRKLIAVCRETGVEAITIDGIEMKFGWLEPETKSPKSKETTTTTAPTYAPGGITDTTKILTEELTEDQLLYYSAVSHSEEKPENQQQ